MPTWAAVPKTHVFRIRNLLLKWRRIGRRWGGRLCHLVSCRLTAHQAFDLGGPGGWMGGVGRGAL